MAYKTAATKRPAETETQSVFELDKKKQVTVRKFNGVNLVDIREFYIDKDSQEKKPGKKGISLTQEVWAKLLEKKDEIDEALAQLDGKKKKVEVSETKPATSSGDKDEKEVATKAESEEE